MDKHLGTAQELCWFAMQMAKQLENHKKEKKPLREWDIDAVQDLVVDEISQRIKLILNTNSKEIMEKQSVHIANYAMMLFLRSKNNV